MRDQKNGKQEKSLWSSLKNKLVKILCFLIEYKKFFDENFLRTQTLEGEKKRSKKIFRDSIFHFVSINISIE